MLLNLNIAGVSCMIIIVLRKCSAAFSNSREFCKVVGAGWGHRSKLGANWVQL